MKMPFGGVMQTIFFLSDDRFTFTQPGEEEDDEDTVNAAFGVDLKQFQLKYTQPIYTGWKSVFTFGAGPQRRDFIFDASGEAFEENTQLNIRQEFSKDLNGEIEMLESVIGFADLVCLGSTMTYRVFPMNQNPLRLLISIRRIFGISTSWTVCRFDHGIACGSVSIGRCQYPNGGRSTDSISIFPTDNLKFIASTGLTSQATPRERSDKNDGDQTYAPRDLGRFFWTAARTLGRGIALAGVGVLQRTI